MATCTEIPTNANHNTLSPSNFREVAAVLDNYLPMMGRSGFIQPVTSHRHHISSAIPRQFAVAVSTFGAQSNLSSPGRLLRSFPSTFIEFDEFDIASLGLMRLVLN